MVRETAREDAMPDAADHLMTIFAEDQPYIWLGFFDVSKLWRDSVKNFKVNQGLSLMLRETGDQTSNSSLLLGSICSSRLRTTRIPAPGRLTRRHGVTMRLTAGLASLPVTR